MITLRRACEKIENEQHIYDDKTDYVLLHDDLRWRHLCDLRALAYLHGVKLGKPAPLSGQTGCITNKNYHALGELCIKSGFRFVVLHIDLLTY
jgi:hypothetical protein